MQNRIRLIVPAVTIGSALLAVFAWNWPLTGAGALGCALAALAALTLWFQYLVARSVTRPLKHLLTQGTVDTEASAEIQALAGRLNESHTLLQDERTARQELQVSLQRAQQTLDEHKLRHPVEATWEWHRDGDGMQFSDAWKAMLGYAPEQFNDTYASWRNSLHIDDASSVETLLRACMGGAHDHYQIEHRLLHRDLSPRWILSRAVAVRDAAGQVTRILGIDTDVSALKRVETVMGQLAVATARTTGEAYFKELVRQIALQLQVHTVLLTRCADQPPSRLRTVAWWTNGNIASNMEYALDGTPCEEVIHHGVDTFHASALRDHFPCDTSINHDSYYGVPVINADGAVLGHLALLDNRPVDESLRRSGMLQMFAARAAAEMARDDLARIVAKLVTELETYPGEERLRQIVRYFADLVGVREAIVTRCVREPQAKLKVLAWWRDGRYEPSTEYNLVGTTCEETVTEGRVCIYPRGVGERFPPARPLDRESYIGVPCFDDARTVIGHLAAFDNKPLSRTLPDAGTLRMFADRAARELVQTSTLH